MEMTEEEQNAVNVDKALAVRKQQRIAMATTIVAGMCDNHTLTDDDLVDRSYRLADKLLAKA
jgi:pantothenate kinase-related protein Tda10